MLNKIFPIALFSLISISAFCQDSYHTNLQNQLQSAYNLPQGSWVFFDNEAAINSAADGYGGTFETLESTNTNFSQLVRATINSPGANPWNSGWNIRNQTSVRSGEKVLLTLSIRSAGSPGKVNVFAEDATTFAKEAIFTVDVAEEWTTYFIPFTASQTFDANALSFGFHLAFQAQTIDIGGFTAIKFDQSVDLSALPSQLNNEKYDGYQADAPWRTQAASNIERIRKANLDIRLKTSGGEPVPGAVVRVNMLRHEFAFGSAITANRIAGNNAQNLIYEDKITNLDGQGHGFNWVVFENDLKWPALEQQWLVNRSELVRAVKWLRDRDIIIRGHTLVWPGAGNMPPDISENSNNLNYIRQRIDEHLEDILSYPGIAGEIKEWDVLNEITTNRSLEEYFRGSAGYPTGREILAEIFAKTKSLDPSTGLWLNDFVTLSLNTAPGNENYDNLKQFTRELLDNGAELDGLGFQGHIGGFPNGIPSVLRTLDDFYDEFGLQAKITEFDLPGTVSEELAGQYLRDFMTAIFSHESMDGFLFWSFWDGATYKNPGANLFREDWRQTPAGDAFIDLVFREWWSDESVVTSDQGLATTRLFKGLYEISYQNSGETVRDTISVTADGSFEIIADNMATDLKASPKYDDSIAKVYPNPAKNHIRVEKITPRPVSIQLFDPMGRTIQELTTSTAILELEVDLPPGIYILKVLDGRRYFAERVIIE